MRGGEGDMGALGREFYSLLEGLMHETGAFAK
jgi:hypothetical protein